MELGSVTAAGAVFGLIAFSLLPAVALALLGPWLPGAVCLGYFRCWPTPTGSGILSVAVGFALAARLYGEGRLALPDVR